MGEVHLEWDDPLTGTQRLRVVDRVYIGRSCAAIEPQKRIILDDTSVSREHVVISIDGDSIWVKDLSRNGTWVNGVRITPGTPMPLTGRDVVQLGKFEVRVRSSDIGGSKDITPSARQAAVATMVHTRLSVVTHLVADVRGFTQISQNTDSETVLKLMGGIIDSFTAITHAHRGTIKDYAGDAVYSFWDHGVSAKPEIGVQACRAALAQTEALDGMREELRARGFEGADGLKLGWGITTGQVAMSAYGASSDLAVVGDSTNLAFRLSGMANKDFDAAVALDRETAELVAPHATLDDLGEHAVRGRAGVEHLWSLRKVEP